MRSERTRVFTGRRIGVIVDEIHAWLGQNNLEPFAEVVTATFVGGPLISVAVGAYAGSLTSDMQYFGVLGNTDSVNQTLDVQFNSNPSRSICGTAMATSGWDVILLIRYQNLPLVATDQVIEPEFIAPPSTDEPSSDPL